MSLTLYLPESGTPEADGRVSGLFTPASRAERLRADGWTECGTCVGGLKPVPCIDCAHGLVPPDGMVYAATRKVFRGVMPAGFQIERVRAGLVAAARWEAPE